MELVSILCLGPTIGFVVSLVVVFYGRSHYTGELLNSAYKRAIGLGLGTWVAIATLGVLFGQWAVFYTDKLWFEELGFEPVWQARTQMSLSLGAVAFVLAFVFCFLNILWVTRLMPNTPKKKGQHKNYMGRIDTTDDSEDYRSNKLLYRSIAILVSAIVAMVLGLFASNSWELVLAQTNSVTLGQVDPVNHKDIGWYLFTLPLLNRVGIWMFILWVITAIVALVFTLFLIYEVDREFYEEEVSQFLQRLYGYFSYLVATLCGFFALYYYLHPYNLIASGSLDQINANYVDVNVRIENSHIMVFLMLVAMVILLVNYFTKSRTVTVSILSCLAAAWLVLMVIHPAINGAVKVGPNKLAAETPYIGYQINSTRDAYDLNDITVHTDLSYTPQLNMFELQANDETLSQARIVDWEALLRVYKARQEIRSYYEFGDVDITTYPGYGEVMSSVREIRTDQLPNQLQNWSGIHLQYTNGYGYVVSEVNAINDDNPIYLAGYIPQTAQEGLSVTNPAVYFGEMSDEWIVVHTTLDEVSYPVEGGVTHSNYEGPAGIALNNTIVKIAFAERFNDYSLKMLRTQYFTEESKLIFRRNVISRLQELNPFIEFDQDPYAVAVDNQLIWIVDGYTTSETYPLSAQIDGANYIRASVVATVNAYTGETNLYIVDESDPLIQAWQKAFPGLYKAAKEMPAEITYHLRYPEGLMKRQAQALTRFHVTDVQAFYNAEDVWAIPLEEVQPEVQKVDMDSRYVQVVYPGESDLSFALVLPMTPHGKQNLSVWMGGRTQGTSRSLDIFRFPYNDPVLGPAQAETKINQDQDLSQDITLWNQQGSRLLWGDLITLPVMGDSSGSVVYIRSIYIVANEGENEQGSAIPNLVRVIIVHNNRVIQAENLTDALYELYTGYKRNTSSHPTEEITGTVNNYSLEDMSIPELYELLREVVAELEQRTNQ